MDEASLHKPTLVILLPLLIIAHHSTEAQITGSNSSNPQLPKIHPTMAVIVGISISAAVLVGLYCYSRSFPNTATNIFEAAAASLSGSQKAGLDPAVLHSFPVMLYSDVKDHRLGSSSLECAVCINEFEDEDSIRLLPNCSHVFHEDCIDAWLASHVTCPVCRAVLEKEDAREQVAEEQVEAVMVVVVVEEEDDREEMRKERKELARIWSRSRRPGGVRKQRKLTRSHTTGHIEMEDSERYTLRLPEIVRNDILVAGRLQREKSLPVRGANKGDVGSSGLRSLMLGLPAKWPSFFLRSRSAKWSENSSVKPDLPI